MKALAGISLALILHLAAGTLTALHAEDKPLKVFIMIGCSNMIGYGALQQEPMKPYNQARPDVLYFQKGKWAPLDWAYWKQFGPEHSFAAEMTKFLGEPVGIIKDVRVFLTTQQQTWSESVADIWNPDSPDKRYALLKAVVKSAGAERPIVICGVCWDQSGRDTRREPQATGYAQNMTHLIEAMHKDFGNPQLPFVCALENTHPAAPPDYYHYYKVVDQAQRDLKIPGFATFDENDLQREMMIAKPDDKNGLHNDHFTTVGQIEAGKRYAATMIAVMKSQGINPTGAK